MPLGRSLLRQLPPPPGRFGRVPDFHLTDENGKPFARADLAGKVWVADFIFTRCPSVCPLLSQKLEKIQKRTRQLGRAFHLVSFSVDPEHDSSADLLTYAHRFHANPRGWTFLTGSLGAMEEAVVKGFKIAMQKEPRAGETGLFDIVHGEHLILVDPEGEIRGYYEANDEGIDQLMGAVGLIVNGQSVNGQSLDTKGIGR